MYYDDNFDYEPRQNKFDNSLNRIIEKEVRKRCKRLYKEYDVVKAENEQLQDIKERYDEIKSEYEFKIRELEKAKENVKRDFFRMNYNEMIKNYGRYMYALTYETIKVPKCERCDEKRKYKLQAPDGTIHELKCSCDKECKHYKVKEMTMIDFEISKRSGNDLLKWIYFVESDDNYSRKREIDYKLEKFDETLADKWYSDFIYTTQEEAQKHCDYLNSKEGK